LLALLAGSSVLCPVSATRADAQARVSPDSLLMHVPAHALSVSGEGGLRGARRFIVPTAVLHLSVDGIMRSSANTLRSTATVRSMYMVRGLTLPFVGHLAEQVLADLQSRLEGQGATVQGYRDVAANPLVRAVPRLVIDTAYRAPVVRDGTGLTTYAVAAPSDSQLFAGAPQRKHLAFRALARESGAVIVIAELWFNAPQHTRAVVGPPDRLTAGLNVNPGLGLVQAALTFITPTGATGAVSLRVPLNDLDVGVGELKQLSTDSVRFGNVLRSTDLMTLSAAGVIGLADARTRGGNAAVEAYLDFAIDENLYGAAVLRGAASFFRSAARELVR
jgi:hypothetical protein